MLLISKYSFDNLNNAELYNDCRKCLVGGLSMNFNKRYETSDESSCIINFDCNSLFPT